MIAGHMGKIRHTYMTAGYMGKIRHTYMIAGYMGENTAYLHDSWLHGEKYGIPI
jgi:hypothetical protein